MKKTIILLSAIFLIVSSCTKDYEDINKNKKDPSEVAGESLFTGAQKNYVDLYLECNVNRNNSRLWVQYWTETTYPDESQYDILNRNVPEYHWRVLYRDVLKDLNEAAKIITDTEYPGEDAKVKTNKLAIIEIMNVFAYSYLVETFGDVPYSQALDIDNIYPVYDDAQTVYEAVLTRLNTAIGQLDAAHGSFGTHDNIYGGNVANWIKLANSLKLRMGLTLADVNATLAQTTVEAAAANVISSNAENANFAYLSSSPNQHPTYVSLVASGRSDHTAANTIVDAMQPRTYDTIPVDLNDDGTIQEDEDSVHAIVSVDYTDPRCDFYFKIDREDEDGNIKDWDIADTIPDSIAVYVYEGGLFGRANTYSLYTHVGERMHLNTTANPGTIFDLAEVEFMLAEAVERGYTVAGTAESHYNAGITASMEYWGVDAADIAKHLTLTEVAYATAAVDWKEKIGTQLWIAMYNNGAASWTHWRRLDFPVLQPSPEAVPEAKDQVPTRYFYPIREQTLNADAWKAAVEKRPAVEEGKDPLYGKLFWDVN